MRGSNPVTVCRYPFKFSSWVVGEQALYLGRISKSHARPAFERRRESEDHQLDATRSCHVFSPVLRGSLRPSLEINGELNIGVKSSCKDDDET